MRRVFGSYINGECHIIGGLILLFLCIAPNIDSILDLFKNGGGAKELSYIWSTTHGRNFIQLSPVSLPPITCCMKFSLYIVLLGLAGFLNWCL